MKNLRKYWDAKYKKGQTGWNLGYVSDPIKEYVDQLTDKNIKILIPGAGNSYEAEYLFTQGFTQVYVADISDYPLQNLLKRVPDFPKNHLLHVDFLEIKDSFDLILEQTFFCTFQPENRYKYVDKAFDLITAKGRIAGVLFDFPLTEQGPPFGGNEVIYQNLFSRKFKINTLERAYNSVPKRMGRELFFILEKKRT